MRINKSYDKETYYIPKEKKVKRHCNLCGRAFKAHNKYMRFCDVCKGRSEVYRFGSTFSF